MMIIPRQGRIIVLVVILVAVLIIVGKPMVEGVGNEGEMSAVQQIDQAQEEGLGMWLLVGSGTCPDCVSMTNISTYLAPEYEENIAFIKVDVYDRENEEILVANDIRFIPTSIFIDKSGQVVEKEVGLFKDEEIRRMLAQIEGDS